MTRCFVLVMALGVGAAGCGDVETNTGSSGTPVADGGAFGAPDGGATGAFTLTRDQACEKYVAALSTRATALGCVLVPEQKCPDAIDEFERKLGRLGQCLKYDEGTVTNCEQRIATFQVCGDFATKSCGFVMKVDETPGCARGDAGGDAAVGDDAAASDSASDGSSRETSTTSDAAASDAAAETG